jgi:hypothetical protein
MRGEKAMRLTRAVVGNVIAVISLLALPVVLAAQDPEAQLRALAVQAKGPAVAKLRGPLKDLVLAPSVARLLSPIVPTNSSSRMASSPSRFGLAVQRTFRLC